MISDSDIIAAMTQAPAEGIRLMMAQYSEPVYWHIRRMVVDHEDAQDATQETFVRLFRAFDTRRDDGVLLTIRADLEAIVQAIRNGSQKHALELSEHLLGHVEEVLAER